MTIFDKIHFIADDRTIDKCIFKDKEVRHFYSGNLPEPDCELCDGYGEDAHKYNWDCYNPKRNFEK